MPRMRLHKRAAEEQRQLQEVVADAVQRAPKTRSIGLYADDEWKASVNEVHIRIEPVTWGFPCEEMMFTRFFENIMNHNRVMPWDNVAIARSTYVPTARNIIHNAFVTEHKTTWLIMLDSDVLPPPNFITKLWADVRRQPEIKLIGGWYKRKTGLGDPVVYDYVSGLYRQRQKPGAGIEPVDAAGAGCWMMHRSVAEAVGPKPYNMNEGGEDLLLCTKVRAAGFQPYIDWDVACAHVGMGVY